MKKQEKDNELVLNFIIAEKEAELDMLKSNKLSIQQKIEFLGLQGILSKIFSKCRNLTQRDYDEIAKQVDKKIEEQDK